MESPDPFSLFTPVTGLLHNFYPSTRDPSSFMIIVAWIPHSLIGWRDPGSSHFPVSVKPWGWWWTIDMTGNRVEITRMILVEERMSQDDSPYAYG